jgi:hypothetical protein
MIRQFPCIANNPGWSDAQIVILKQHIVGVFIAEAAVSNRRFVLL